MNINKDKKVESIKVKKNRKISELLSLMENTGFQGKNLAKTVSVFENMVRNPDVTILFGYAASLSTTCLLYTSPSPRDVEESRMPSSA